MIKRLHVNQHHIRANRKDGGQRPVISVKTSRGNTVGHEAHIEGPSRLVYSPDKPLSCGARLWMETQATVVVLTDEGEVHLP